MYRIGRLLGSIISILTVVSGAAVMLMMFHVVLDVTFRNLFSIPLPGTLEIVSEYYMVLVVFLPLALVEQRNAHIDVEVVTRHLPRRVQRALASVLALFSIGFFAALCYRTWLDSLERTEAGSFVMGATVDVPTWPSYYFMPVGCGMIVLVLVYKLVVTVTRARNGLPEPPKADSLPSGQWSDRV